MKKFLNIGVVIIIIFGFLYLVLPSPVEPPPLPNSFKSTEPGDTGQISGLFAYYTNMSRSEVVNYYKTYFEKSKFFNIPLITVKLNHPPEYAWQVIRDTEHSSFLEELVHPFRETWYLNGYEPANDPFVNPASRKPGFEINGQKYTLKIQVRKMESNIFTRLFLFTGVLIFLKIIISLYKKLYEDFRNNR